MAVTPLSSVVQVNIVINQAARSQVDFGLACLLQTNPAVISVLNRQKKYTNLTDVLTDFVGSGGQNETDVVNFATDFFGQAPQPRELLIGTVDTGGAELYQTVLLEVHENVPYYFLAIADQTLADAVLVAINTSINTITAQAMFQKNESAIDATSSALQLVNAFRCSLQLVDTAQEDIDRVDAALLGSALTHEAGVINWGYRRLNSVAASTQNPSALQTFLDNRINVYSNVGGTNVTRFGYNLGTALGYIDQIQSLDFIKTRIEEDIFSLLANSEKVPYTDAGAALLEAKVSNVLNQAAALDIVDINSIAVSTALVSSVSAGDRANRIAPPISFTATLSGAINTVVINGVLEV